MRRGSGAAAMALLATVSACGGADPCDGVAGTCVAIRVEGQVANVDELHFDLCGDVRDSFDQPLERPRLPVLVVADLPATATGRVAVSVVGVAGGETVAFGAVTIDVVKGRRLDPVVRLAPVLDATPIITCVEPRVGPTTGNDTPMKIHGANFRRWGGDQAAEARFNAALATNLQRHSSVLMTAALPGGVVGPASVSVTHPTPGAVGSATGLFAYYPGLLALTRGPSRELTESPFAMAVADFDGDGRADVALTDSTGVRLLHGRSDGTLEPPGPPILALTVLDIAAQDIDRDGDIDLVVVDRGRAQVIVLLNSGQRALGFPTTVTSATGAFPEALRVVELDGDGYPDLVLSMGDNRVATFINDKAGTFRRGDDLATGWRLYDIGDMDRDGRADFVVIEGKPVRLGWVRPAQDGSFEPPLVFDVVAMPTTLTLVDLDGDRRSEVVFGTVEGEVGVVRRRADGSFENTFKTKLPIGMVGQMVAADLDGDGRTELVTAGTLGTIVLRNDLLGVLPVDPNPLPSPPYTVLLAIGDIDGDGLLDVVTVDVELDDTKTALNRLSVVRNTSR